MSESVEVPRHCFTRTDNSSCVKDVPGDRTEKAQVKLEERMAVSSYGEQSWMYPSNSHVLSSSKAHVSWQVLGLGWKKSHRRIIKNNTSRPSYCVYQRTPWCLPESWGDTVSRAALLACGTPSLCSQSCDKALPAGWPSLAAVGYTDGSDED